MDLLGKKLKQQKELREKAKRPRKKQEYTPVEVDTGLDDDERGGFENDPEPGEETTIKMKPKNKPLPLPPTKKAGAKTMGRSPKLSPGIKQRNSTMKSPSDSASNNQLSDSGRLGKQPQAGVGKQPQAGVALMQELTKKKGLKSTSSKAAGSNDVVSSPSTRKQKGSKPLPSPPAISTPDHLEGGESEPVYANAIAPEHVGDTGYQNCDFDGPPTGATPTSAGGTPGAGGQSEYQNINFGVQKPPQTKKKPKINAARSPNTASKNRTHSNAGHTHPNAGGSQANGSVAGNSAGEYQNFQFGVPKN